MTRLCEDIPVLLWSSASFRRAAATVPSPSAVVRWCVVLGVAVSGGAPAWALSLQQAQRMAIERHPDVAQAQVGVSAASADVQTAGQRPLPALTLQTVNIDPARGVGKGPLWHHNVDTTVGLSWVMERGRKRELRVAGAEAQRQAAQADWTDARRQRQLAVAAAYYDLAQAQARLRLIEESWRMQQRGFEVAQRRWQAGDLSAVDLARLQVESVRAEADWRSAQTARASASRTLSAAMGLEPTAADLVADDPYPAVDAPGDEASDDAGLVAHRPDVRAAALRLEASMHQRDLAEAALHRDVTWGVSAERFPPDNRGSLGLSASVPLFWGHAYEGERGRAAAEVEAARLALLKQGQLATLEVHQATDRLQASRDRLQALEGPALQAAQRALAGVELAYERGAAALTDVLDARRQLRALQLDLADARADHARALAAWRAATRWDD